MSTVQLCDISGFAMSAPHLPLITVVEVLLHLSTVNVSDVSLARHAVGTSQLAVLFAIWRHMASVAMFSLLWLLPHIAIALRFGPWKAMCIRHSAQDEGRNLPHCRGHVHATLLPFVWQIYVYHPGRTWKT